MARLGSFLRIVRAGRIVTVRGARVPPDAPDFPAYSQVYLRNYSGQLIVTAGLHWGFSSERELLPLTFQ